MGVGERSHLLLSGQRNQPPQGMSLLFGRLRFGSARTNELAKYIGRSFQCSAGGIATVYSIWGECGEGNFCERFERCGDELFEGSIRLGVFE